MTTILNLWGGPGVGKSTTAARVYALRSSRGESVELVREYVKDWAWRGQQISPWDPVYLTAKQLRAESALYSKVDLIVTDSPIGTGALYERLYSPGTHTISDLSRAIREQQRAAGLILVDVLVPRIVDYRSEGRYETAEQALLIDQYAREWVGMFSDPAEWLR